MNISCLHFSKLKVWRYEPLVGSIGLTVIDELREKREIPERRRGGPRADGDILIIG